MALDQPRLGLPRAKRIRETREYATLRREGRRAVCGCLVANWRRMPGEGSSRVGVIASRRVGSAVIRNRAKRLLREAFRLHQHELVAPVELVLVARASIVGRRRADVEHDLIRVLRRGQLMRER